MKDFDPIAYWAGESVDRITRRAYLMERIAEQYGRDGNHEMEERRRRAGTNQAPRKSGLRK